MLPPGCLALLVFVGILVMTPIFFAHAMLAAVARLGLPPELAMLAVLGIFAGGAVNIPVKRIERYEPGPLEPPLLFGFGQLLPHWGHRWLLPGWPPVRTTTVIAVNVGGCLIPCGLAAYEVLRVMVQGAYEFSALLSITALNVYVCYRVARPVASLGIVMPALIPPLLAAAPSLVLVPHFAPPVAFTAGVLGPLIGADLLHLREIERLPVRMASIGGAGTFDGIVLSGMLAALLA